MIKQLLLATTITFTLLLMGCGSGPSETKNSEISLNDHQNNDTPPKQYNLWEYLTPSSNRTNSFSLYTDNINQPDETYSTTYTVSDNLVVEVSSLSESEKTIYEKKDNEIVISFQKDGLLMGFFTMQLQANIDDIVTKKTSNCKLAKHYPIYDDKFEDVIEISCDNQHGFYQKGIGEVAQVITDQNNKTLRIISN